jgi:uncharacterized membrane protein YdcZ (DUF606 family)
LQAPINARLGTHLGDTPPAAATSFLVGFVVIAVLTGLSGRVPSFEQAASAP